MRYQQNLQLMRQLVPTSNEVPALLEQVSTAARRVDLDINTVTPEPVLQGEQFDTYRYKLTVIGGYHELAEFLTNVGSLTRIVAPVNIELHPSSGNELATRRPKAGEAMLTSKFEIQTYVAKQGGTVDDMPRSRLKQGAKT
jgi:type IV pilus assembly protein PilO